MQLLSLGHWVFQQSQAYTKPFYKQFIQVTSSAWMQNVVFSISNQGKRYKISSTNALLPNKMYEQSNYNLPYRFRDHFWFKGDVFTCSQIAVQPQRLRVLVNG